KIEVRERTAHPQPVEETESTRQTSAVSAVQTAAESIAVHEESRGISETISEKEFVVPDYTGKVTGYVKEFFTTGNVVVKTGVIILFFGVAFLISYVVDRDTLPVSFWLSAIAAGGIVLIA